MTERSPVARRLSAPARLLSGIVCLVSVATAPTTSWIALTLAALIALALVAIARPRPIVCAVALASALLMGASLTWPMFASGDARHAASLLVRSLAATTTAVAIGSTFSDLELGSALRWLRLPRALVDVIETLLTELALIGPLGERMALARRLRGARGFDAGGELLAGLFVLSAERAERLALSRQLRGYDDRSSRSSVRLAWSDVPGLTAVVLVGVLVHAAPRML